MPVRRKPTDDVYSRLIEAWREMRRGESMQAYRDIQFEGLGITELGQSDALQLLAEAKEMRVGELARALRIERSTATRTVDRLESMGLASRFDGGGPGGAASRVVKLTPLGRATNRKIQKRRHELLEELVEGLSPERLELLADALETIVNGIDRVVERHANSS